jgi:hypothetical protein
MTEPQSELPGPTAFTFRSCQTWSLANPHGPDYGSNLPLLLRRVADQLDYDGFEPMEFLGLTVEEEMTEHGPWFSVSVFWSPDEGRA